jgi:hypothetical protein
VTSFHSALGYPFGTVFRLQAKLSRGYTSSIIAHRISSFEWSGFYDVSVIQILCHSVYLGQSICVCIYIWKWWEKIISSQRAHILIIASHESTKMSPNRSVLSVDNGIDKLSSNNSPTIEEKHVNITSPQCGMVYRFTIRVSVMKYTIYLV